MLTDVVMPEMGGREVAERLAVLRPATKLLFMSGYTDSAIVHHGLLDARTEFLQKPFSATVLARKVRAILDVHAVRSHNPTSAGRLQSSRAVDVGM